MSVLNALDTSRFARIRFACDALPNNSLDSAPTNRISDVNGTLYSYDAAGNVTDDDVHTYTYDAENRIVSVDSGSTATYSYDHQNRRIKKVVSSTTTHYIWAGSKVIAEHNGSTGTATREDVYAGSRIINKGFLYDRLSIRGAVSSGSVTMRQTHLPFGEEMVGTGTTDKHKFTSYERDSETGTDYAVNRQYGQIVGRFMHSDPYNSSAKKANPQSWNRFSYTINGLWRIFGETLSPVI